MHPKRFVFGVTALFLVAGIVTAAEQGRSGAPKATKPTSTAPKMAPSAHATPKATKPVASTQSKTLKSGSVAKPAQAAKPPKTAKATTAAKAPSVKSAKTQKPAPTKLAKADKTAKAKVAKAEKPAATKVAKAENPAKTAKSVASSTTAPAAVSTTPLTAVQEKLKKNTNLAAKLTSRLPAGTDLMTASAGFRNLGQFVAAVNVSNNLGISFTQLKTKMVTGGMSLGQAIQELRPLTASATVEAQRAEYDARGMIAESELQPQPTAPTSSPTASKSKAKAKTHTR